MIPWCRVQSLCERTLAREMEGRARQERVLEARRALATWYDEKERELMRAIAEALIERAGHLMAVGASVQVLYSSRSEPIRRCSLRHCVRVLFLGEEVLVYSARDSSGALMVHWARVVQSRAGRFSRLISVPGLRVRRGPSSEVILEWADPCAAPRPAQFEDIVQPILCMVVELAAARRQLKMAAH